MRVLMISKALVAGTSQRKLEELAKCPGVELTLVTPPYWQSDDGSKQALERLYTSGYQMIVTPMRLNGNFHLHYYPQLGKIMREQRPEIVHIDEEPYNFATFHAMRLANKQKARALFFTWQNLYRDYPPPFRQVEFYNYRHAAAALAGNRDAAEVLKRKGYSGPIFIIPQFGFDTDIYQRTEPRRPRSPGDPFTLGFVGRLKDNKGLDLLVSALAELPDYCRVVFIGNGQMKEQLAEQAAQLGVAERVIFKGGLPTYEIPKEMQQFDALVLPSVTRPNWIEQFGRVLPEAMACETPVIGSSSGEIPTSSTMQAWFFRRAMCKRWAPLSANYLTTPPSPPNWRPKGDSESSKIIPRNKSHARRTKCIKKCWRNPILGVKWTDAGIVAAIPASVHFTQLFLILPAKHHRCRCHKDQAQHCQDQQLFTYSQRIAKDSYTQTKCTEDIFRQTQRFQNGLAQWVYTIGDGIKLVEKSQPAWQVLEWEKRTAEEEHRHQEKLHDDLETFH